MKRVSRGCCSSLVKAIEIFLRKANENLADELEKEGYLDAEESVEAASELEDEVAEIFIEQTEEIDNFISAQKSLENALSNLEAFFIADITRDILADQFRDYFNDMVRKLANIYIEDVDNGLVVEEIRQRTTAWIDSWAEDLADMMQLSSENQIRDLINSVLDDGGSADDLSRKLMVTGVRNEEFRARKVSLTEMLRAHSVAQQEAMTQSPSVTNKKWRHTSGYRIAPRQNHVDMDGQIVAVDKPFKLIGIKGSVFYPMYPRDPILPAEEAISCHCLSQPVVDEDILGMSLEERQKLQQQIIDEDDGEWEKELDEKNRTASGTEDTPHKETLEFAGPVGSQDYKDVDVDSEDTVSTERNDTSITASRVVTAKNELYVSDSITLKPREMHNIDNSVTQTLEKMKITDSGNLPRVVVISDSEFQRNAVASYNPVENTVYVRTIAGRKNDLKKLQKAEDYAEAKNPLSTYIHEYHHWKDAEEYRSTIGDINTEEDRAKYLAWNNEECKKKLEKLAESEYDLSTISGYATRSMNGNETPMYYEVYTEYRVKKLLGE